MKRLLSLLMVVATLAVISCQKTQELAPTGVNHGARMGNVDEKGYNERLDVVAMALAKSLADEKMRAFVKSEASKRVDGDFNILYSTVQERMVGKQTFGQMINQSQLSNKSGQGTSAEPFETELPLLNISVPVHIRKWDVSQFSPMVVVLTDGDESKPLKAFDKDGNVHWLDPMKAPDFPVVVVGRSERYTISAVGGTEMKKGLLPTGIDGTTLNEQIPIPDPGDPTFGGGEPDNPGNEPPHPPVSNDCNDATKTNIALTGWFSGNLSAIESWARGAPEIRMRAFGITQAGTKVDVYGNSEQNGNLWEPSNRNQVNGRWWNLNDHLFNWNVNSYGEELTFVLQEEDGGNPKDITIPVTFKKFGINVSANITFRVDDGDDYIGHFPRELRICSGSTIGNHTLQFKINRN